MSIFTFGMDFKSFNNLFSKIDQYLLPGKKAHLMLSPTSRKFVLNKNKPKKASVLIFCYPKNTMMNVILIRRPDYIGFHSGEISFPGGKFDIHDKTLEQTALREFHEETGVQLISKKNLIKFTPLYIPLSNFMVTPFFTYENFTPQFFPEPKEVTELIDLPISELLKSKIKIRKLFVGTSKNIEAPCFKFKNQLIWGATAMILNEFKIYLASQRTN